MELSNKQKRALEKITGKHWNSWHPFAVEAYFAYTDGGQHIEVPNVAENDFNELMFQHHWHSVTVESWKKDFKAGLLFLDDFLTDGYPDAYIQHAFEIYREARGFIPSKYLDEEKATSITFRLPNEIYAVLEKRANKQGRLVSDYLKARVIYDTMRKHHKRR